MRNKIQKKAFHAVNYQYDMFGNPRYNYDLEFIYSNANFFNKARRGLWVDQIRVNKFINMFELKDNKGNK